MLPLVLVGLAVLSVCVAGVVLAEIRGVPASAAFKDAYTSGVDDRLAGAISVVGVMSWTAAAAVALFVALLTTRDRALMVSIGIASGVAALDDQFLLHESVPDWVPAASQLYVLVYGTLAVLVALSVYRSRPNGYLPLLLAAALFLGLSAGMDMIKDLLGVSTNELTVAEDTLKLLGIGYWLSFAVLRGLQTGRESMLGESEIPSRDRRGAAASP